MPEKLSKYDESFVCKAFAELCTAIRVEQTMLEWNALIRVPYSAFGRTVAIEGVDASRAAFAMDIALPCVRSRGGCLYVIARTYVHHGETSEKEPFQRSPTTGYHLFAVHKPLYWEIVADDKTQTGLSDHELSLMFQYMEQNDMARDAYDSCRMSVRCLSVPLSTHLERLQSLCEAV